jgi:hypothetical protein
LRQIDGEEATAIIGDHTARFIAGIDAEASRATVAVRAGLAFDETRSLFIADTPSGRVEAAWVILNTNRHQAGVVFAGHTLVTVDDLPFAP